MSMMTILNVSVKLVQYDRFIDKLSGLVEAILKIMMKTSFSTKLMEGEKSGSREGIIDNTISNK